MNTPLAMFVPGTGHVLQQLMQTFAPKKERTVIRSKPNRNLVPALFHRTRKRLSSVPALGLLTVPVTESEVLRAGASEE